MDNHLKTDQNDQADQAYEAPKLESVLTPEEVEREVHYAGEGTPVAK